MIYFANSKKENSIYTTYLCSTQQMRSAVLTLIDISIVELLGHVKRDPIKFRSITAVRGEATLATKSQRENMF